ncbi:NAD(P)H-quinone oxidoreductase [Acinetobacter ursingii]|uniref:NAD(P)H-quinone oxidoreductase n=1 Tax=Acinetobacter ursingii TaxID=108980 RepID=A0A3D2SP16_9GAMM|nr:NAD(P)H-quinone oxidoreductase [Acinetobacter ursingii]MCH2005156.1 NAD(P)H-quinone oxidoreductase [Acinetobacter ursingii]MCU4304616.1 NAD(P)H-quinone oxidoreductase [Acinetobacter ursingii]MCU4370621.1 NAD(P)H-quinone oxidoreductase [Acinetobacter ursingii]MCU4380130.1 NAD(P)H-quinone oxidoreductase [Acinetobacter ursingii]MCU4609235.1 NAD(P)H-quinone oxidoreductase [Acinetobacter ursingii]
MTILPNTMRHIEISQPGEPEVLKIVEAEIPQPKSNEILIQVKAAGINRPDVLQRKGLYPMPKGVTPIPGLEVAGIVAAIGENVRDFKIGDRVCALTNGGGYAEYCIVPASQTLMIPENLNFVQAAAIPETYYTVWANLFDIGQLKVGETALIHGGASGIGTTALSICHALGIQTFCTVGTDAKVDELSEISTAINYKKDDFEKVVLEKTEQKGVDVILDIVGAKYFTQNMNLLKRDGRLVILGFMGGRMAKEFDLQQLILKRAKVTGSTMRARTDQEKAEITQSLKQMVWPLLEQGKSLPIIYKTFAFEDVAKAHITMEQSEHIGKIVLELN